MTEPHVSAAPAGSAQGPRALMALGVSPRVVMETLGHSQVSLTLNTYSHVLPSFQKNAAAEMDAILGR